MLVAFDIKPHFAFTEGTSRKPQTKRRRIKAAIVDSSSSEEGR